MPVTVHPPMSEQLLFTVASLASPVLIETALHVGATLVRVPVLTAEQADPDN